MRRWQTELTGFLLMLTSAYAALALFVGQAGEAGAAVATALWHLFGFGAAVVLLAALALGWRMARYEGGWWSSALHAAGLLAGALAALLTLELVPAAQVMAARYYPAGVMEAARAGGEIGRLAIAWLTAGVGLSGTYLAVAALYLVALTLTTRIGPSRLMEAPVRLTGRAVRGIGAAVVAGARRAVRAIASGPRARQAPGTPGGVATGPMTTGAQEPDDGRDLVSGEPWMRPVASREPVPVAAAREAGDRSPAPGSGLAVAEKPAPKKGDEGRPGVDGGPVPVTGGVRGSWRLPPSSLLAKVPARKRPQDQQEIQTRSRVLEQTFSSFGIDARVVSHTRGPVVTRYEMALAPGIKLSRVTNLANDLALALATTGVRIEAPVPGKPVIGIEVPNAAAETVYFREVLESPAFARSSKPLTLALGKDIAGDPLVGDLERIIHLLIAGATGSGKSVCIGSIIVSLLYRLTPDQLRLLLIDPKRVELTVYDGVPHLLAPVVTETRQAALALRWAVREMEARYQEMARVGARHLAAYNEMARDGRAGEALPFVVVVIDELADLMMVAAADVEDSVCRLAQMARAAGIHLVIATQRPSTDVITGLIKANIPSRLAFAVSSQVDSRTILDAGGAERLLGRGDMLYHPLGEPKPVRAQGCLVTEKEIEQVVRFWREQGPPQYRVDAFEEDDEAGTGDGGPDGEDPLYGEAVNLVTEAGQASVSMLQRRFRIGYARAARLVDIMERRGIVGPYQGSKPREVLGAHRHREHSA